MALNTLGWAAQQPNVLNNPAFGQPGHWQTFGEASSQNSKELGTDFPQAVGSPIPGIDGIVSAVKSWGYGDFGVSILQPSGQTVTVGHVTPLVSVGQKIMSGQTIGTSRGLPSPHSSSPHVELQIQNQAGQFVNPVPVVAQTQGQDAAFAQASGQGMTPGGTSPGTVPSGSSGVGATGWGHIVLSFLLFALGVVLVIIGIVLLLRQVVTVGSGPAPVPADMQGAASAVSKLPIPVE